MHYPWKGNKLAQAVLTDTSITEEIGIVAEEAVVMQRLNHWHSLSLSSVIDRWRY
jgi:hypothetical protein